ncbi:MAG: APC family permease [Acetobacteraceae bacterium]
MHLKREIGLLGLTFVVVSGVIGSGWLFAPLLALQIAGPAALLAWLIGGVAMLLLALTYAEIAAMLPVPGGIARVPQFSHGNVVAMVMGWSAWLGYTTTAPIEVEAMLKYLAPHAGWLYAGGDLTWTGIALAGALLALFTVINAFGVKLFATINSTITWAKLGIPALVIVVFLATRFVPGNLTAGDGFAPDGLEGILSAVSAGGVIFAFIGFRHAVDLAGETRRPQFTVPFALIAGLVLCFLIYAGIQLAFIGAMQPRNFEGGWRNVVFLHDLGPVGSLATTLGLLWLVSLMNVGAVIGPFGGGLVAVGSDARLLLALAQNGLFPAVFERLSRQGVPLVALLFNLAVATAAFVLLSFQSVLQLHSAAVMLSFVVGPIAVVALRHLLPDRPRAFRVPMVGVLAPAAFVIGTFTVYWSGWATVWRLGVCLVAGFALLLLRAWQHPERRLNLREAGWLVPYLAGLGLLSLLGPYGGGLAVLPFGWDMAVCAVFAVALYRLAVASRLRPDEFDRTMAEELAFEEQELDAPPLAGRA